MQIKLNLNLVNVTFYAENVGQGDNEGGQYQRCSIMGAANDNVSCAIEGSFGLALVVILF